MKRYLALVAIFALVFVFWQRREAKRDEAGADIMVADASAPRQPQGLPTPGPSATPAGSKATSGSAGGGRNGFSSLDSFLEDRFPGSWVYNRSETGRIDSAMGGIVPGIGKDEQSVFEFAKQVAESLGIPESQLSPEIHRPKPSQFNTAHDVNQVYQGYDVYGARLRFITRNSDQAAYMINNELQKFSDFDPSKTNLTLQEATQIAAAAYGAQLKEIKYIKDEIYADSGRGERVHIFHVTTKLPEAKKWAVLVGVISRKILHTNLLTLN